MGWEQSRRPPGAGYRGEANPAAIAWTSGWGISVGVGAQWELRCPLARRDQRFARAFGLGRHTSARSNALRRDPCPPFRLLFERVPAAAAPDGTIRVSRGYTLTPLRLRRGCSPGAVRPPGPGRPGPPRSETSARGATLLPRELETASRLTDASRFTSRGFGLDGCAG